MADTKNTNNGVAVGLLIGAAAGAVGVMLTDKTKREQVTKTLNQVKKWSDKTLEDWQKTGPTVKLGNKVTEVRKDAESIADDMTEDVKASDDMHSSSKFN